MAYGRFINLKNPDTFFAKLNWLKLNDRNPRYTQLVDKYNVKKYIAEKIGAEYLVPLIGVYQNVEDIDFDSLPDAFIIKATHGAAWNIICTDKSKLDVDKAKKTLNKWLRSNFYKMWGEYPYRDVEPKLICEELLFNENEPALIDYKFHCFHGIPKYIQTDRDRFHNHKLDFYDLEWNRLPFGLWFPRSENVIPKPHSLAKMIELATILSRDFKYIRVDFYEVNDKIYFGELTLYPCNGFGIFDPSTIDYKFGELLEL
jgi:hypothetical protein